MNKTKIEWTDYTWNPVTGCTKISQGCKNCYAERMTKRFSKAMGEFRDVLVRPERLMQPTKVKKPSKIFVCDVSDLFHEDVPFEFIMRVFNVMDAEAPWHTYQVLTKRIDRAIDFIRWFDRTYPSRRFEWPVNVWIGTSVEDQKHVNLRVPALLEIPAKVRFLSCEPLLGELNLAIVNKVKGADGIIRYDNALKGSYHSLDKYYNGGIPTGKKVHWVIAGGESGPNARPVHPEWIRFLRDQCADAGVPFFFKQWGEYRPYEPSSPPFYRDAATGKEYDGHGLNHVDYDHESEAGTWNGHRWYPPMDSIGWCVETKSDQCTWLRMGKGKAGNMLDGKQHLEYPL